MYHPSAQTATLKPPLACRPDCRAAWVKVLLQKPENATLAWARLTVRC